MAHFSRTRGWISRPSRSIDVGPDPYDAGTAHHAERFRATYTTLPDGLVRVDLGEPIK